MAAGFGWPHPKQKAGADPPTGHPSRGARPLLPPPASPPPHHAGGPLRESRICPPRAPASAPRREGFSENSQKNGHLAYTGLATWQWARPSLLDSLYLLQLSNLRELWNLGLINKGRES